MVADWLYAPGPPTHTHCTICAEPLLNPSTLVPLCAECRLIIYNRDDPREGLRRAEQ